MTGESFGLALAGILLISSFALLGQRRITAMVSLVQLQAWVVSAAAIAQGFVQGADGLYVTGIITLSAKGILLPLALRRIARHFNVIGTVESVIPIGILLILGATLVVVAVMAVRPGTAMPAQEYLAIALSVLLLGLLVMIVRRNLLAQAIGFLSAENGLLLAAVAMPGMPFVPELSVAILVLPALLIAGMFLQSQGWFEALNSAAIDPMSRR